MIRLSFIMIMIIMIAIEYDRAYPCIANVRSLFPAYKTLSQPGLA